MRQYIKEISSNSIIYTIANFLTKAVGIILIPIYTRYLTKADYGILAIITPLISVIMIFFDFGMRSALHRFFFDHPNNSEKQKIIIGNIVSLSLIISSIFLFLLMIFGAYIFPYILPNIPFFPFIFYAILTAFFLLIFEIKLTLLRVQKRALKFGIFSFLKFLFIVVLTIVLVVTFKKGAIGKIFAEFIVTALFSGLVAVLLILEAKFKIDKNIIKQVLKYSIPLIPYALSGIITAFTGRYFVNYYEGLESAAIFNIGFLIGSIMQMIVMSINSAWMPFFTQKAQENKADSLSAFSKLTTYYTLAVLTLSLFIIFFAKELTLILATKQYIGGIKIVPIIVVGYLLNGFYFVFASKIFYVKTATKLLARINIPAAIINIFICLVLVPKFGMLGAAWASLIYYLIISVATFIVSQKIYYIPYDYKRLVILLVSWSIIIFAFYIMQIFKLNMWAIVVIKLLLIALFLLFLHWFRFLKKSEISNLYDILHKVKKRYTKK